MQRQPMLCKDKNTAVTPQAHQARDRPNTVPSVMYTSIRLIGVLRAERTDSTPTERRLKLKQEGVTNGR